MRRITKSLVGLSLTTGLVLTGAVTATGAPVDPGPRPTTAVGTEGPLDEPAAKAQTSDNLDNPLDAKQQALRQKALHLVLTGQRKIETINGSQVVKVGTKPAGLSAADRARVRSGRTVAAKTVDQYVELSREKTDKIFVVLTEFGNQRSPQYPDRDTNPNVPGPATFDGPLHNQIPKPDRGVDNRTIWQPDYSADYFRQLYFGSGTGVESLKTYYETQSSGRYSVDGMVTDWVKVPYNEARYGRSTDTADTDPVVCADIVCPNTWALLTDGLAQWITDELARGVPDAQIRSTVKSYDQHDRYDYDGDGNFNEPDGYIDHFQIVHAGGDEADGDPQQGEDAIWSHRWYAYANQAGRTGPAQNLRGGTQIGDTGVWVGDYTIQPENGGLSVFAHEYGHDLGLPDHYDTAGGGDNPVNWWTLMAQSRARAKDDVGIGTRPADLGSWDKLQLGWLDYETAVAGQTKTFQLGPHEYNSGTAQGVVVVLPKKVITTALVAPRTGAKQWWSGSGNDLTSSLSRRIPVPTGGSTLTFAANYDIEAGYDYAQVQVDDGSGFVSLPGGLTTVPANNGIDGSSGGWKDASYDLSAYSGKTVTLRFRYVTDGAAAGNDAIPGNNGFFVDDVAVTSGGTTVFADGAENGVGGWTATGFSIAGSTISKPYDQYYIATNRSYVSYDRYLQAGPYNFGFGPAQPSKAEFFPYQQGLLINYWDTSYTDNNTSQHPGGGLVLPIDAHPEPIYNLDGVPWRGRIQTYDAPFSLLRPDSFTLHNQGKASYLRGAAAQPLFDDTRSYVDDALPRIGVKTPGVGVTMRVTRQDGTAMTVRLGTSTPVSAAATLASARRAG